MWGMTPQNLEVFQRLVGITTLEPLFSELRNLVNLPQERFLDMRSSCPKFTGRTSYLRLSGLNPSSSLKVWLPGSMTQISLSVGVLLDALISLGRTCCLVPGGCKLCSVNGGRSCCLLQSHPGSLPYTVLTSQLASYKCKLLWLSVHPLSCSSHKSFCHFIHKYGTMWRLLAEFSLTNRGHLLKVHQT